MTTPPDRRLSVDWWQKAREVDAADGEWLLVAEDVSGGVAHRIKTGQMSAFRPAGAYDAKTSSQPGYQHYRKDIYVRKV